MIISGGENVYSAEVEHVLYQHPALLEVAVIGIPHEKWGESVHAVVTLRPGMAADEAELVTFARERIADFKAPRTVSIHHEPLPKSGAGKILKRELRSPYWQGQRQVH
jgi:long-chain acyl-CoA synthetase